MEKNSKVWLLALLYGIIVTCGHGLDCVGKQYPGLDPQTGQKICICQPGFFQKDGHCHHCRGVPLPGSREEVKRPCTSVSQTEIGCISGAYRLYDDSSGGYVCMSCTLCEDYEDETTSCTEFHDRKCYPRPSVKGTTEPKPIPTERKNCSINIQPVHPSQATTTPAYIENQTTKANMDLGSNSDNVHMAWALAVGLVLTLLVVGLCIYFRRGKKEDTENAKDVEMAHLQSKESENICACCKGNCQHCCSNNPIQQNNTPPKKDTVNAGEVQTVLLHSNESGIEVG